MAPQQVHGSQCGGSGHVWACPLESRKGKLGLARVVPTDCQGIPKGLADHALKVRVHADMRAQPAAKGKPRAKWCLGAHERGATRGPIVVGG